MDPQPGLRDVGRWHTAAVLGLGDHSVPHIERWNHLLYVLDGTGEITIDGDTVPVRTGTVCQVRAGEKHSLQNLGDGAMLLLAIYDPPRTRLKG